MMKFKINKYSDEKSSISIIGVVGVPGAYGGFETLAENLVRYWQKNKLPSTLSVYCTSRGKKSFEQSYLGAELRYLPINANGGQSIIYDALSIAGAIFHKDKNILILGVSGALFIPMVRLLSSVRIITNIDGIEWRRDKWRGIAKKFLRLSEWAAVKFSHVVVTDNQAICDYVTDTYQKSSVMIPYGGDHALESDPVNIHDLRLPSNYALALCRIEPENNVAMILKAFSDIDIPLVFVGNWDNSCYGRELKKNYAMHKSITLLDPVYDPCRLRAIRNCASLYIHGHSAGGTNPSLVEIMHFAIPVFAYGCAFNRHTTEDKACYFLSEDELVSGIISLTPENAIINGRDMGEIARRRYTWSQIGKEYFDLFFL